MPSSITPAILVQRNQQLKPSNRERVAVLEMHLQS